ncbi:MAG: type VI secretion system contractile sheath large subunit [Bryobacteraceae bacterium]
MPNLSRSSVHIDLNTGTQPRPVKPESDTPFRILLLGDFSGRRNRGEPPPSRLRPYLIDRDNFDEVMSRIRPELDFSTQKQAIRLRFRELEDFHPDRIFEHADFFEPYRSARRSAQDPAKSAEAAAAVSGFRNAPAAPPPPPPEAAQILSTGSLLDDVLEASEKPSVASVRKPDALQAFIERAVAPHVAPREDPRTPELLTQVDTAAGNLMRVILHHPDFQALEAAWRAVFLLCRRLETGTQLKLYILDVAQSELGSTLPELRRILVTDAVDTPGAEPWALVAGNFTFVRNEADAALLDEIGRIAQAAGVSFLAEANPADPVSGAATRAWGTLRHSPHAACVGLALPRFLLRLPYGRNTDSLENFAFEEMPDVVEHRRYLWGNPAFACVYLLAEAFTTDGWDMRPGSFHEIGGLPLHVYEEEGVETVKPCAEVLMTETDAEWVVEQGFMPLVSIKNQDAARLLRFQSIADPPSRLTGAWNG